MSIYMNFLNLIIMKHLIPECSAWLLPYCELFVLLSVSHAAICEEHVMNILHYT